MVWHQKTLHLQPQSRGVYNITRKITSELASMPKVEVGLAHLFLLHTSASLTINENADPTVLTDLENSMQRLIPENWPYKHSDEGPDDMPAHLRTSIVGWDLTVPVQESRLVLGTWQGIYLWEHRNQTHSRKLVLTLHGQ